MVAEIIAERTLLGGQPRQVPVDRAVLGAPQRLERHEGAPVHQERLHVVETGTQRVEDGEAVGVDVAPVVQAAPLLDQTALWSQQTNRHIY